ncbi:Galactokinase [Gossypium arboreum]|uniref:Galactokinase n=1 Tax=Gossypium arboreum TaxID=29729 RepID=A0A0B0MT66_GOSAR|nr:Galactokinase [Gossypium arboreum]
MSHITHISFVHKCTCTWLSFSNIIYLSNVLELDTHSHSYSFLEIPIEPFGINKDTRIAHKLIQCQHPRRGFTCNQILMPLS